MIRPNKEDYRLCTVCGNRTLGTYLGYYVCHKCRRVIGYVNSAWDYNYEPEESQEGGSVHWETVESDLYFDPYYNI